MASVVPEIMFCEFLLLCY